MFARFGGKDRLAEEVAEFCRSRLGYDDVIALCESYVRSKRASPSSGRTEKATFGFVYLMKSGRHYKIGRTNAMGRRERELIKIPVPPRTIHFIETDDPAGVESYWHRRFAEKRVEGEWLELSIEDVKAFKRWKRIV